MLETENLVGNVRSHSPGALAFLGDAVFELLARERLFASGSMKVGKMHMLAVKSVNAGSQAQAYHALLAVCSDEEAGILKRGRNSNTAKVPKSTSPEQYRKATGIEALFGYLYLQGKNQRIRELFEIVCAEAEQKKQAKCRGT